MTTDSQSEDIQRWTAKRKAAVVLDLIAGKTKMEWGQVCDVRGMGGEGA